MCEYTLMIEAQNLILLSKAATFPEFETLIQYQFKKTKLKTSNSSTVKGYIKSHR